MIDKLQNYYGIAIRSNVGDLNGMRKAIMQVSSIVRQVNGVIFTPTVQLDPRAAVVSSETETVLNILLACLML